MKKFLFAALLLFLFQYTTHAQSGIYDFIVTNAAGTAYEDALVKVSYNALKSRLVGLERGNFLLKDTSGNNIPFQVVYNEKGEEEIIFVTDLNPNEQKTFFINYRRHLKVPEFKSRTYAELGMKPVQNYDGKKFRGDKFQNVYSIKVPLVHTDHDALFKYEGPGWESEKIGYRFYLDWRNANDIFGKKEKKLVLSEIGTADTVAKDDSYHNMQNWGMDIFKVGNTLGIGSIGMLHNDSVYSISKTDSIYFDIKSNGPVQSEISTKYFGWQVGGQKYNLYSSLSIHAGSRMTKCDIQVTGNPDNITTGLAKYAGTEFFSKETGGWSYIALYGNQTLVSPEDKLGIAVIYSTKNLKKSGENDLNYLVELKPEKGTLTYYFCAAWEQEPDGIKTKEEFQKYLDDLVLILNNPPIVKLDKK